MVRIQRFANLENRSASSLLKSKASPKSNAVLSGAQGQQQLEPYVTPNHKHAVNGEIVPFGAHPFAADQKEFEHGINGPSAVHPTPQSRL